jgi:hypothetical protein
MPEDFLNYPEYKVGSDSPYYTDDTATSQSAKGTNLLIRVAPVEVYQAGFGDLAAKVHAQHRELSIPITMTKGVYNKIGVLFYREDYESVALKHFVDRLPSGQNPSQRKKYLAILESMYELNLVDV